MKYDIHLTIYVGEELDGEHLDALLFDVEEATREFIKKYLPVKYIDYVNAEIEGKTNVLPR